MRVASPCRQMGIFTHGFVSFGGYAMCRPGLVSVSNPRSGPYRLNLHLKALVRPNIHTWQLFCFALDIEQRIFLLIAF